MRRLRYAVATSLDGFIAGPKGEADWIAMDESADFGTFFTEFDTVLMGRSTYEITLRGPGPSMPGMQTIVCTRTLKASDHPNITVTADGVETVTQLKSEPGKDIWLFGGGDLFRSLLDAQLVDTVELGVMPILLSQGVPLLPPGVRAPLLLSKCESRPTGMVGLTYSIQY